MPLPQTIEITIGGGLSVHHCLTRLADNRSSDVLYFPKVESLAIGYIAAYLRANNFKAEIVDEEVEGFSRKQLLRRLLKADLVGFTAIAKPQIFSIIETVKELRQKGSNAHFTIGGQYATFLYKELLQLPEVFDSVVLFEGEQTFKELVTVIEQGKELEGIAGLAFKQNRKIKKNKLRSLIHNLDSMPFPARDTLSKVIEQGGLPVISSSRGCYNRCSYCSISSFYSIPKGNSFRLRTAKNVLAELQQLKNEFPAVNEIWFVDDNFVMSGASGWKRTVNLCKGVKELGLEFQIYLRANDVNKKLLALLKESGLQNIFIGAEAANDFTLQKIFNKNISTKQNLQAIDLCSKMGISVDPGFIMFHPWSTMHEIGQNIHFLEETGQYTLYGILSYLTPYTFTPIGKRMLSGEISYKKPKHLPAQELNDFIPYEIMDERAELLLSLTLGAFEEFKKLPQSFSKLKQKIRKLKSSGMRKEARVLERKWNALFREMNQTGMEFFKELFYFLKQAELRDDKVRPFFEDFKARIQLYAEKTNKGLDELIDFD